MSDKYNNWLGELLKILNGCDYYAITLGQTTYYSESKEFVDVHPNWRKHENVHKTQWAKEKGWKFALKYLWYNARYGYDRNPYEVEAGNIQ